MSRVTVARETTPQKRALSEKVAREKEELLSTPPRLSVERIKAMLEIYRKTEGQPAVIRRAKVFEKLCQEKKIFIDNNPFVGTHTEHKYGGPLVPEVGCRWMKKVDAFSLQRGGNITIDDEQRRVIEEVAEYWEDKNVFNRTKDIILQTRGVDIGVLQKVGVATEVTGGGPCAVMPDYGIALTKGLNGLLSEVEEERTKLDVGNFDHINKLYFYNASEICFKALISLAHRYAALAKEMAEREANHERKRELLLIAKTCKWVPANAPRSFYEALQSLWFLMLGAWIEIPVVLFAPPLRFTQYMYPFYRKDNDGGKITDDEVIELLQFYFLKIMGLAQALPPHGKAYSSSRLGQQLAIGGLTPEGKDATNELDWLVLEAQQQIQLPEPLIALVYHDKLSEEFLMKCVDLIRTGIGQPAFHDINKCIGRHLYHDHTTLEEARNIAIAGCVQSVIPGYMYGHWEGYLNTAKMIELVLNNGKDPLTGIQIGLQTGEAESFQSYEQLWKAMVKQLRYFTQLLRDIGRVSWNMARDIPIPFSSAAFTYDCIKNGKDAAEGGPRYSLGNGVSFVAVVDLANSLAAIKKLVFEEQKLTLKQLKAALAANFEGYEEVHQLCLQAPKYGNDDDYVDSIVEEIYDICWEEHQRFPDHFGRPVKPMAYSVIAHSATGRFTGALPNGRKACLALTDATVSAQPGTDRSGPTALVRSAAKVIDTVKWGTNHFNMKFHPSALQGAEGARKFLSLIKTYFDLGGYHCQFNCVSSETLIDAQLHPENYRNLVVRVAGFSAFFVTLDKLTQDEIIQRTELGFN